MTDFFDNLETQSPEAREQSLLSALPNLIRIAKDQASGWGNMLKDVDPTTISSREALATLPVLRKSEITSSQSAIPPLGGFTATPPNEMGRLFMSPGSIFEPEGTSQNWWRTARALHAAGFRKGDIIHNTFSYHMTPGGFILDAGARALGCPVIPAGVGNTDAQLQAITHFKPNGFSGTPDYLKALLDKAAETRQDASSITKALVSGAALPPSLRDELKQRGVSVLQAYITADLGLIAYESEAIEGMILDEEIIVEIVRPGTGDPVAEGDVGEVVVTSFNADYPLIRFATGDLSEILPGQSPCGRTNTRIKGWMGRADQTTKVKGMFVHPSQIADITSQHPELTIARLIVTRDADQDVMTLEAESTDLTDTMTQKTSSTVQTVIGMKATIKLVQTLPRDGQVIIDKRSYD